MVPLAEAVVSPAVRRSLFLLFSAVAIVLALACANVTNLSLVRTTLRSKEVAVRAAIGAGRLRLVRQFLTESLCLSVAGGLVGLGIAWVASNRLVLAAATQIPRAHEVGLDWGVFTFLSVVCVLTLRSQDWFPLWSQYVRPAACAAGSRRPQHDGHGSTAASDSLVIAEVALACLLAIGAAILVRELGRLRNTDLGMVTSNVVTFHVGHRMRLRPTRGSSMR